jgi:hypothetical protein
VYFLYPRKGDEANEKAIAPAAVAEASLLPSVASEEAPDPASAASPPAVNPSVFPVSLESDPTVESNGESRMTEQTPPAPPVPDRRLFPVVTLLRDEVTGQLALQVGQTVYQDPQTLRESSDWTRVEFAARDLARWVEGSAPLPRRPEERRAEETPKSGSMVEQINRILEAKLTAQSSAGRGVRLIEGPGGSVRVFIGVQSYALDEVPDEAISGAIREAVAEWEASR